MMNLNLMMSLKANEGQLYQRRYKAEYFYVYLFDRNIKTRKYAIKNYRKQNIGASKS